MRNEVFRLVISVTGQRAWIEESTVRIGPGTVKSAVRSSKEKAGVLTCMKRGRPMMMMMMMMGGGDVSTEKNDIIGIIREIHTDVTGGLLVERLLRQ